jgi:hypothetical protein
MRKLICWACGQEILRGKFLHCTACGVNFGEECWHTLSASLVEEGASRPKYNVERERQMPLDDVPPWSFLGQMLGKHLFLKYLLDLVEFFIIKRSGKTPQVLYQCNNCLVDVDYRVADAALYQKLMMALKEKKDQIVISNEDVTSIEHIGIAEELGSELKQKYHQLAQNDLQSQLKVINMAMGANWIQKESHGSSVVILNDRYL